MQKYMKDNNVEIIVDKKYILLSNSNFDITDTILKIYKLTDNKPDITEFQSSLKSPSGEPAVGSGNFAVKK